MRFNDLRKSPSTLSVRAQGFLSGAGRLIVPCRVSGQSPLGCNKPDNSTLKSSRSTRTASICKPLLVHCAAICMPLSCSMPLNNTLPTLITPTSIASGNLRSGRLMGPLLLSSLGGNCKLMSSACSWSMHKVMRVRQPGDQAKIGLLTSTRLVPCSHNR